MRAARIVSLGAALLGVQAATGSLEGRQPRTIARAVAGAPDGIVRMTFASRAGACGNGNRYINIGETTAGSTSHGFGQHGDRDCIAGPARVALTVEGGRPVRVRTTIGAWSSDDEARITDLGVVPAREAVAYFLSVVPQLESSSPSRALLPVVVADSANVVPGLLALMRDRDRRVETRRHAMHWARVFGDETATAAIRSLVDDTGETVELRRHAIFALLMDGAEPPADITWLSGLLARLPERKLREQVVFVLSRRDEPAATDALIRVARNDRDREVRKKAWFWLGQMKDPRAERAIAEMVLR